MNKLGVEIIDKALLFARGALDGVTTENGEPMIERQKRIANCLSDYLDPEDIAIGVLSKTMEKSGTRRAEAAEAFGDYVANGAEALLRKEGQHIEDYLMGVIKNGNKKLALVAVADRLEDLYSAEKSLNSEKIIKLTKETKNTFVPIMEQSPCFNAGNEKYEELFDKLLYKLYED
jgi:guanosine-3',5'-bis(diphosphate) 3'-pyrophosphohydrolase